MTFNLDYLEDKIAADFVEHCATRWQSGKALFVCIDKITWTRTNWRSSTCCARTVWTPHPRNESSRPAATC